MKKDLPWLKAIEKVMEEEKAPLHYTEIAELISEKKYRINVGATPANTVNVYINGDLNNNKSKSIFAKVPGGKGEYILRKLLDTTIEDENDEINETLEAEGVKYKIIEAYGVYWNRDKVLWKTQPDLLGVQQIGAETINFSDQIGVYLLHDGRETIYVGQAFDQSIGKRLNQHTYDRLSGRWDRFSWYGLYKVSDDGELIIAEDAIQNLKLSSIVDTLEAILIEGIEPRQNRKKGNTFSSIEYLQKEDPELKKKRSAQLLEELRNKL